MELRYSEDLLKKNITVLDNLFITDYMPYMNDNSVKCYLYSLYLINNTINNKDEQIKAILGCDSDDLISYYQELQELGLIAIKSSQPLTVEFLPINADRFRVKKYNKDKYSDFVKTISDLFQDRALLPNEILRYIEVIEEYRIAPEAMIMIIAHCQSIKGSKISVNYILTVAKAWANEGVTSLDKVEDHLRTLESNNDNLRKIFYELGLKSMPDFEDKQLYLKWTLSWGYDIDCIIAAAKQMKKKGGTVKLDTYLDKLYRSGIFTLHDIVEYTAYNKRATSLAMDVISKLGLYYQDVSAVVSTYIADWINQGFEDKATLAVASYCFKRSVRTLEGMNIIMNKFFNDGLTTLSAINNYIDNAISNDKLIRDLFDVAGAPRTVKEADRKFYGTWTNIWGFQHEVIKYAAELSIGKMQPTSYINVLLSKWHQENRTTLDACKQSSPPAALPSAPSKSGKAKANSARFEGEREYTKEELDSVFDSVNNFDDLLK